MTHGAKFLGLLLVLLTAPALAADTFGLHGGVTGRWTAKLTTPAGRIMGEAELTQIGNQVTGWLVLGTGDPIPLSGALLGDKFVITMHPQPRRHDVAFDRCEVAAGGNRMKGTIYPGKGTIEFVLLREPRVPADHRQAKSAPPKK